MGKIAEDKTGKWFGDYYIIGRNTHMLDDASRSNGYWSLCVAAFSMDDVNRYLKICKERFNIIGKIRKDVRYIGFDKESSKIIDAIILRNIPNTLYIIRYKIMRDYAEEAL